MNCGLAKKDCIVHRRSLIICRSSAFLIFFFGNFVRRVFSSQESSSHSTFRQNNIRKQGLIQARSLLSDISSNTSPRMLNTFDYYHIFLVIMRLSSEYFVYERTLSGLKKNQASKGSPIINPSSLMTQRTHTPLLNNSVVAPVKRVQRRYDLIVITV